MLTTTFSTPSHFGWLLVVLGLAVLVAVPTAAQMAHLVIVSNPQRPSKAWDSHRPYADPSEVVTRGALDVDGPSFRNQGSACQQATWPESFGL